MNNYRDLVSQAFEPEPARLTSNAAPGTSVNSLSQPKEYLSSVYNLQKAIIPKLESADHSSPEYKNLLSVFTKNDDILNANPGWHMSPEDGFGKAARSQPASKISANVLPDFANISSKNTLNEIAGNFDNEHSLMYEIKALEDHVNSYNDPELRAKIRNRFGTGPGSERDFIDYQANANLKLKKAKYDLLELRKRNFEERLRSNGPNSIFNKSLN